MAKYTQLTPKKREDFLAALAAGDTVSHAAGQIGARRETLYKARKANQLFAAAWDEASEEGTQALEQEAKRRAIVGTDKPVYQGGQLVGYVREYSDTLLIFLLKAKRPTVYREQVKHDVDHRHPDGPAIIEVVYTDATNRLPAAASHSPGEDQG